MAETDPCTRCGDHPQREGQQWCAECHARYMQGWRRTSRARLILQCHREGGRIACESLIKRFSALGLQSMNGVTAAEIIRTTVIDYSTLSVQRENARYSAGGRKAQEQYRLQKALRGNNGKA